MSLMPILGLEYCRLTQTLVTLDYTLRYLSLPYPTTPPKGVEGVLR